ncbi:VanZ family protein [Nocardiopsis sp. NPDC058631]|uniref:VanZ family protein n=1 Tax=Nocardiopsis sp. NPDC058631 TaxID=3346566 RepID=UPI003650AB2C
MAILLLFAFSLVLSALAVRSWGSFPQNTRKVLAAVAAVYILVLVMPASGASPAGSSRFVEWNPLGFVDELAREETVEESFGQYLTDGSTARYSPEELTEQEREEVRRAGPVDFYVYGAPETGASVVDAEGEAVPPAQERIVLAELSEGIEAAGEPLQYQTMIVEEKALNALLFVPLGILAFFSFSSWWVRLLFGPSLSVVVEALQWITAMGKVADTADALANSARCSRTPGKPQGMPGRGGDESDGGRHPFGCRPFCVRARFRSRGSSPARWPRSPGS